MCGYLRFTAHRFCTRVRPGNRSVFAALLAALALTVSPPSSGAGFDTNYIVHKGHFNTDGRLDFYVRQQQPQVIILPGDTPIPLVLPPSVEEFVLEQKADRSFTIVSDLTADQKNSFKGWPQANVKLIVKDFNFDGAADVLIKDVANVISGALDQMIFAATVNNLAPVLVRKVDAYFREFFDDLYRWYLDPTVFNEVETFNVDQTFYIGVASGRLALQTGLNEHCYPYYSNCGFIQGNLTVILSSLFGLNCVDWVSEQGEDPDSHCVYGFHVFGSATVMVPVGTYNLDAYRVGEIARDIENGQAVLEDIADVFERVIGIYVGGAEMPETNGDGELDTPDGQRGYVLHVVLAYIWRALFGEGREPDVVYITGHRVRFVRAFHLAVEYTPPDVGSSPRTLSAFEKDDFLYSMPNREADENNVTLGTVASPLAAATYYNRMVAADNLYKDKCLEYDLVPEVADGYNSNSWVHGLVRATGGTADINLNLFVGGSKPVPNPYFAGNGSCNY